MQLQFIEMHAILLRMSTIKAYKLQHSANLGKRGKIIEVVKAYRILATSIASGQWVLFNKTGSFNKDFDVKHIKTPLEKRSADRPLPLKPPSGLDPVGVGNHPDEILVCQTMPETSSS